MRTRSNWILAAAVAVALAAGTLWSLDAVGQDESDRPWPRREMRGPGGPPDLKEALGLSDEQAAQMRALHFESAKAGIQARTEVKLRRLELEQQLSSDEPNQAAIDKTLQALSNAQHSLLKNRVSHRLAMRQILTPEQRKKMEGLHRMMRHHRRHGRFDRRGPRGGPSGFRYRPGRGERGFGPGAFEPELAPDFAPEFEPEVDLELMRELEEPAF